MQKITPELFQNIMDSARIAPRVKREVRFVAQTTDISDERWSETELLTVSDRAGNKGVILLAGIAGFYAATYEVKRGLTSRSGGAQAIICDFCRTWQTGSRSGSVTLQKPQRGAGSVTFLCCADMDCSRHVRNLTSAAKTSRSQLREDMSTEERVARLEKRIDVIAAQLGLQPLDLSTLQ